VNIWTLERRSTGDQRKLSNVELHISYSPRNIIRVIKSRSRRTGNRRNKECIQSFSGKICR